MRSSNSSSNIHHKMWAIFLYSLLSYSITHTYYREKVF